MTYKTIVTNHNLLETIEYQNIAFPLSFYEERFDDYLNGEIGYHWHNDFEFGILLKGELKFFIHHGTSRQEYEILRAGDGVFVNSKSLHRLVQTEPGTILLDFVFPANFFVHLPMGEIHQKSILPITKSVAGLFLRKEEQDDRPLLSCIEKLQTLPQETIGYELSCMELLCRLWRQLLIRISNMKELPTVSKSERLQEQRLRLMLSYIHSHYGEPISINSIAEAASISRSECFRCFRAVIGKTPSEYLCQYRLSQAAYFLSGTSKTLSDICFSCGFKSMSYFGKVFRENGGVSPGQYRKMYTSRY